MNQKNKNIFRWIAVLPGAYIGAYYISFPVRAVTYEIYSYFAYYFNMDIIIDIYINPFLPYFVAALAFTLIGSYIAPTYKKLKVAIVLSVIYCLVFVTIGILALLFGGLFAGLSGLGTLTGELLAIFIIWIKYKIKE